MNVLKLHLRIAIETLLRGGASHREIERRTGVDRKTIRGMARRANSPGVATGSEGTVGQIPPPRPPADSVGATATTTPASTSACEPRRVWIESQVQLGRNAVSIYQDLVEGHGLPKAGRLPTRSTRAAPQDCDLLRWSCVSRKCRFACRRREEAKCATGKRLGSVDLLGAPDFAESGCLRSTDLAVLPVSTFAHGYGSRSSVGLS